MTEVSDIWFIYGVQSRAGVPFECRHKDNMGVCTKTELFLTTGLLQDGH